MQTCQPGNIDFFWDIEDDYSLLNASYIKASGQMLDRKE
jgi:hypothetical protein